MMGETRGVNVVGHRRCSAGETRSGRVLMFGLNYVSSNGYTHLY